MLDEKGLCDAFQGLFDQTPRGMTQKDIEKAFVQALRESPYFNGCRRVVISEELCERLQKRPELITVGPDIEGAVTSLCMLEEWGDPDNIEEQPSANGDFDWYVTFRAGGAGFKAAGKNLPGGVVLTWWK